MSGNAYASHIDATPSRMVRRQQSREGRMLGLKECGAIHGALGRRWGSWVSLASKAANTTRHGRGAKPVCGGMCCYDDVLVTVRKLQAECNQKVDCTFTIEIEEAPGTLKARYAFKQAVK